MLKKRIIGVVVVKDGLAVQSFGFSRYLPIGRPEVVVEYLNNWGIDEIAVVDITATAQKRLNLELVFNLSKYCRVPLTFGGGIKSSDDMVNVVQSGADKVMINQSFLKTPEIVTQGAGKLGNQCIVVSIDVREGKAYNYLDKKIIHENVQALAKRAEKYGAGEIFLNSVDRDGSKTGYDLGCAETLSDAVKIPVTLCGGVGHPDDFEEGLKIQNVSAVGAANFFTFTEHSVAIAKQFLIHKRKALLRHDTYFNYADAEFMDSGRIAKKDDGVLKEMLFEFHPQEKI